MAATVIVLLILCSCKLLAAETNATGSNLASQVFSVATFAFATFNEAHTVKYTTTGSQAGECNLMGFWHTSNLGTFPSSDIKVSDQIACSSNTRDISRSPLVDWIATGGTFTSSDYANFPDLVLYPAMVGALVPVYNLPEIANLSTALNLGRMTLLYIYTGVIQFWDDSRIINDNPSIPLYLFPHEPISVILRADACDASGIFTNALALFDPSLFPYFNSTNIDPTDTSFAATVTGQSTGVQSPSWCDLLTDEIQIITVSNCIAGSGSLVRLAFINPVDSVYRVASFACDADITTITDNLIAANGGAALIVTQSALSATSYKLKVGYYGNRQNNVPEPIIFPSSAAVVIVTTLQEGGYLNAHYVNTLPSAFPDTQRIYVNASANYSFTVSSSDGFITSSTINIPGSQTIADIMTAVVAVSGASNATVTATNIGGYDVYTIQFSATNIKYPLLKITVNDATKVFILKVQDGGNYPQFPDLTNTLGVDTKGGQKYTCYKRELNYTAWSYYASNLPSGVLGSVMGRKYSIGYTGLGSVPKGQISIASMINKAGFRVQANSISIGAAALKVTTFPISPTTKIADSPSDTAWPMSGFIFFAVRTQHHIGDCSRRKAAMEFIYNFYHSNAANIIMKASGFSQLPDYYRDIVVNSMISNIICNDTGELALGNYLLKSFKLIGAFVLATTFRDYIAAYNNVDRTMQWTQNLTDDSLSNWNAFIASPDSFIGIYTMFPSAAQKLKLFAPVAAKVSTSSFATVAVVPIYHNDAFAANTNNSFLRTTVDILAGIYCGTIKYWNDTLIQKANAEYASIAGALTNQRIYVVVRSDPSDVTAVFTRFLAKNSALFRSTYSLSGDQVEEGVRYFDYTVALDPNYLIIANSENLVDFSTVFKDGAFAYWLQNGNPNSYLAWFCPDAACNVRVNPANTLAIQNCTNDPSTVVYVTGSNVSAVISSDMMVSTDLTCFPIVATVDWSMYSVSDSCPDEDITHRRVQYAAWLYGNPATAQGLSTYLAIGSNVSERFGVYSRTCHLSCNGTMLGFDYCDYRFCTYQAGDFIQSVSGCDPGTQERTVTYFLTPDNPCLLSSDYAPQQPVYISCDYVATNSRDGASLFGLAVAGFVFTMLLMPFSFFSSKNKLSHAYLYMIMFIAGAAFLHLSIYLLAGVNTEENCKARPWCINVAATVMFAPHIMKLNRKVYKKSHPNKPWYRDYIGIAQAFVLVAFDMICLAIVSLTTNTGSEIVNTYYPGVQDYVKDQLCIINNIQTYEVAMIVYKMAFMIYGVVKSVLGRGADSDQAEEEFLKNMYDANITALAYFICTLVIFSSLAATARGITIFVIVVAAVSVITIPMMFSSTRKTAGKKAIAK